MLQTREREIHGPDARTRLQSGVWERAWLEGAPPTAPWHGWLPLVRVSAVLMANALALLAAFFLGGEAQAWPMIALLLAVIVSSWLGGPLLGLGAVALSTWAANYLVFSPYTLAVEFPEDFIRLTAFSAVALLVSGINSGRAALERSECLREAAEKARNWAETLLDQGLAPVVLVRPETQERVFANRAARELAGGRYPVVRDGEEGPGRFFTSMGQRMLPEQMPGARAARGEEVPPLHLEWHLPEGTRKLLVSARRLVDGPAGEAVVLISYQDFTEVGEAVEALRRSEALYETLAEAAPVGIFHVDAAGRLLYANTRGMELLGLPPGAGAAGLRDAEGAAFIREWATALEGRADTFECRQVDGRGVERWLSVSLSPLTDGQQEVSYVVTVYDLTDRKRAEEQLHRLSEHRAELVATVSHALRGPIAAMLANLEVLQEAADGRLAPRHRRLLEHAVQSAVDLSATVDDVLSLSRLQSGEARLTQEFCDLPEVLRRVYHRMLPRALSREVALELRVGAVDPIRTDYRQVELLVTELVENAVKYSPSGTRVALSVQEEGDAVRLAVRDHGPGIPHEELPHVFEPFYRGAAADRSQAKGSGLGLAIAARVAGLLGGELTVGNHPKGGAEFRLRLPRTALAEDGWSIEPLQNAA